MTDDIDNKDVNNDDEYVPSWNRPGWWLPLPGAVICLALVGLLHLIARLI